ncbi:MAG TPA: hypothetical protein PK735_14465, partial [Flavobacteriales bacterium]|nr:hypothetical protein [Flavobacteriales bacterium]
CDTIKVSHALGSHPQSQTVESFQLPEAIVWHASAKTGPAIAKLEINRIKALIFHMTDQLVTPK